MKNNATRPNVFVLAFSGEMGRAHASALSQAGARVKWFSDGGTLIAAAGNCAAPVAIVVDLDAVDESLVGFCEELRTAYPSSELLALSSADSSRIAIQCLSSGFSDFLLKPISPQQLAWNLQQCCERRQLAQKWADPKSQLMRTMIEISGCLSPLLVRIATLKFMHALFGAQGVAWLSAGPRPKVLCTVPGCRKAPPGLTSRKLEPAVYRSQRSQKRRLVLAGRNGERLVAWGIAGRPSRRQMREATAVLEYGEMNLRNLKKLEQIKRLTFIDDLTGLFNSRYLKFYLGHAVAKSKRNQENFSVLFIDLDRFKSVNDRCGHTVGSDLLVALARTLRASLRSRDPVFRYGGDEFVVILQNTGLEKAYEIAERLRSLIEKKTFQIRGHAIGVTISVGIAVYPDHAPAQEALLRLADEAMYNAKKQQRNAVRLALSEPLPEAPPPEAEPPDSVSKN